METPNHIKETLSNLPLKPGVYRYFDKDGKILYVGKAKKLKNRVSSYFNKNKYENGKTRLLVKKVDHLEVIVTDTEFDALLLENSLIKKHKPPFNIQLRDDKTYPWICIKKERFPRVFATRQLIKDGSEYYGPYASVRMMKTILDLVGKLYKTRTCSYNLSKENIEAGKFRLCLEHNIGNCLGPCEAKQSEASYNRSIDEIRNIIKGNIGEVVRLLKEQMQEAATNLEFELAHEAKTKLELLEKYQAKSTVVNPSIHNVDVFSILSDVNYGYVNFMKINNGAIIQSHTIELKKKMDETDEQLLEYAIPELRDKFNSVSPTIYTSLLLELEVPDVHLHHPQRGDKKKLIDLSEKNAHYYMRERHQMLEKTDPDRHVNRLMLQMKEDLRLTEEPKHIECFDNSNFQGSFPVAACVVFNNGKPNRKEYRHFNIKTVEGPNDFASMEEVVYRRYRRLLNEDQPLPQLIVIDGGKGQLSSAVTALDRLGIRQQVAIIGIAKKLEELFYPGDSIPLYLDKRSETLKVIQHLRNEAHRFGITFHRNKRSKGLISSELKNIKGIGDKTAEQLLTQFKSVKRIRDASEEELVTAIGLKKTRLIQAYFAAEQ